MLSWRKNPKGEGRRETDAEKTTISVLAALEHALAHATKAYDPKLG